MLTAVCSVKLCLYLIRSQHKACAFCRLLTESNFVKEIKHFGILDELTGPALKAQAVFGRNKGKGNIVHISLFGMHGKS